MSSVFCSFLVHMNRWSKFCCDSWLLFTKFVTAYRILEWWLRVFKLNIYFSPTIFSCIHCIGKFVMPCIWTNPLSITEYLHHIKWTLFYQTSSQVTFQIRTLQALFKLVSAVHYFCLWIVNTFMKFDRNIPFLSTCLFFQ